jgi:predicted O-methyltransferase YrrM
MVWKYYTPSFEYKKRFLDLDRPWAGHTFFVYDLVRNLQPKTIVELGTERGTSFFSMCQAVKDGKIKAKLYAVDIWKGDKHTGYYGESVYKNFIKYKNAHFSKLKIEVFRMFFDEAVVKFKDSSIDLLHIDGLHTYEAVKHDFETWCGKVKPNGIVLFHDIVEKGRRFGVHKLWRELKAQNNTIEFLHSHGLGVLIKDQKLFLEIKKLEAIWQRYYSTLYDYNLFRSFHYDSSEMEKRKKMEDKIKRLEDKIKEYEKILGTITSAKTFRIWQSYCRFRDSIFK